jgi:hypothetical protein
MPSSTSPTPSSLSVASSARHGPSTGGIPVRRNGRDHSPIRAVSYYEDLAGRLYGLLIGLDDRIGREQAQLLHHFIEVGEYGLALEEIAGTLAQDAIAITGQERRDMMALAAQTKLEADLVPRAPAACPEKGDREHR